MGQRQNLSGLLQDQKTELKLKKMSTSSRSSKASKAGEIKHKSKNLIKGLDLTPEERKRKNEDKYTSIRKVLTLMIHCVDCDDEECALMPYCLDYQDLLVHMEECCDKKCRLKVFSRLWNLYNHARYILRRRENTTPTMTLSVRCPLLSYSVC